MKTLKKKEWVAVYAAWKRANPHLAGDDFKQYRRNLARGCTGKAQYESYGEAMQVVAALPVREGRVLHAYLCPICAGFHVGNTAKYGKPPAAPVESKRAICPGCWDGMHSACTGNGCYCDCQLEEWPAPRQDVACG